MLSIALALLAAIAASALTWWWASRNALQTTVQLAQQTANNEQLRRENEELQNQKAGLQSRVERLNEERTTLVAQLQALQTEVALKDKSHADALAQMQAQIESERQNAERIWREQIATWQEQWKNAAAEQLQERQKALQSTNRAQIDMLLTPIKDQFAAFQQAIENTNKQSAIDKQQLANTFEQTLRLFEQQQQQAVAQLREQTAKIGTDAANLTKALKGDSKAQGDWGEMVLATMLEHSGLRRGEEFFVQESRRDEQGKNLRPDVIVR
ncbi:MAG: DNA recombination protein RmuC, partial [Bacteroidaceae bacterium]|nr:DNA recombination protein RmuC [Bacteroidaceae bacterium]